MDSLNQVSQNYRDISQGVSQHLSQAISQ